MYPENCSECGVLLESAAHGCSLGNLRRVVGELQILFDVAGEIVTLVVSLPQTIRDNHDRGPGSGSSHYESWFLRTTRIAAYVIDDICFR